MHAAFLSSKGAGSKKKIVEKKVLECTDGADPDIPVCTRCSPAAIGRCIIKYSGYELYNQYNFILCL